MISTLKYSLVAIALMAYLSSTAFTFYIVGSEETEINDELPY